MKNLAELEEIMKRAKELIKMEKEVTKILYQLAFVYTNNSPRARTALELMNRLAQLGLVSPRQITKAIEDVRRWRKMRYKMSREFEFEVSHSFSEKKKKAEEMMEDGEEP